MVAQNYFWNGKQKANIVADSSQAYVMHWEPLEVDTQTTEIKNSGVINYGAMKFYKGQQPRRFKWSIVASKNGGPVTLPEQTINYNYFYSISGNPNTIAPSNLIYLKFKELLVGLQHLETVLTNLQVTPVGSPSHMPQWFTLVCTLPGQNTIAIANALYETELFEYAYPDWMIPFETAGCATNDPLYGDQWHLENTGQFGGTPGIDINVCEAWEITRGGANAVVAVVDNGLDKGHPDLGITHSFFFDTERNDDPEGEKVIRGGHGQFVAGIINSTKDNNEGVTGIAPITPVMSIVHSLNDPQKDGYFPNLALQLGNGIKFATINGASIINCSWGAPGNISYPDSSKLVLQYLEENIRYAIEEGRDGLGSVVVFASGNTSADGVVDYPGNTDDRILVTGNIDACGLRFDKDQTCMLVDFGRAPPSGYGEELDLMAPGTNILSTDAEFTHRGLINGSYYGYSTGTSFAAPMVAAVASMMLTVNPNLTQKEVSDILLQTARKVREDVYTYDPNVPERMENGSWNIEMGHGLLDAGAAVQRAKELCEGPAELYTQDTYGDHGLEPYELQDDEYPWLSHDIWVKQNQTTDHSDRTHEVVDPTDDNGNPKASYVYVSVRNRGCSPTVGFETVTLHWAKAGTALSYPNDWNGVNTLGPNNAPAGMEIATLTVPAGLKPGQEHIMEFEWFPPNPDDYDFSEEPWHFCLLSVIRDPNDPFTMYEEINTLVLRNNKVAWRNTSVNDPTESPSPNPPGPGPKTPFPMAGVTVGVGNPSDENAVNTDITFNSPTIAFGNSITNDSEVFISMPDDLYNQWLLGGAQAEGIRLLDLETLLDKLLLLDIPGILFNDRNVFEVTGDAVRFGNIPMPPGANYNISMVPLYPESKSNPNKDVYEWDVVQRHTLSQELVGGVRLELKKPYCNYARRWVWDETINLGETGTMQAYGLDASSTIFRWTNATGQVVSTEASFEYTAVADTYYELQAITDEGCSYTQRAEVDVQLPELAPPGDAPKCYSALAVQPNPVFGDILELQLEANSDGELDIVINSPLTGEELYRTVQQIQKGIQTIELDIRDLNRGTFILRIQCGDTNVSVDNRNFIKL